MSNHFKFSTLRQFGSENISFTVEMESDNKVLSEQEIDEQLKQVDYLISKAFVSVQEREISEKALLAIASDRRRAEVAKLDEALKAEMEQKKVAEKTMQDAQRLSDKINKKK